MKTPIGWIPGALAVIVVSEWPRNIGRVVQLIEVAQDYIDFVASRIWVVECTKRGHFDGYEDGTGGTKAMNDADHLRVAQWQMRLLVPGEFVEELEGLVYTVEHADA